jgi:hypothetical protein
MAAKSAFTLHLLPPEFRLNILITICLQPEVLKLVCGHLPVVHPPKKVSILAALLPEKMLYREALVIFY